VATIILVAVMVYAAKLWTWLKRQHIYLARGLATGIAFMFFSYFFSR
jgi:hypothetical protein